MPSRRRPLRRAIRAVQRRRRRAPEDARREILDAAERLFGRRHPDAIGLVDVARAAGVSHALVTHYFGTYAGVVDAVLERRQIAMRDRMIQRLRDAGPRTTADELLAGLFAELGDPVQVRLWLWTLATERPAAADFFPLRHQGLRVIATQVATALAAAHGVAVAAIQAEVELALLVATSAAFGYCLGRPGLVGSLGRTPSPELDAQVRQVLGDLIAEHLQRRTAAIGS